MTAEIHCGDCVDLLPTLDIQPDLILTSPPYGKLRDFGGHGFDFDRVADSLVACMPEGGVLVWVVGDQTSGEDESGDSFRQALGFKERGLRLFDTMIYQKNGGPPAWNGKRTYQQVFDYMFVFSKGQLATANRIEDRQLRKRHQAVHAILRRYPDGALRPNTGYAVPEFGRRSNVWTYDVGLNNMGEILAIHEHPAVFPLALAKDHIRTWTNPGDLVLDPMAGSGTVLRAAMDLERRAVGIEIHEPYVGLIRRRLAQQVMPLGIK